MPAAASSLDPYGRSTSPKRLLDRECEDVWCGGRNALHAACIRHVFKTALKVQDGWL
jgi:hypothetical protein